MTTVAKKRMKGAEPLHQRECLPNTVSHYPKGTSVLLYASTLKTCEKVEVY